jgi:pimeloyl-ACP methyl ester carboxylesterase
VSEGPFEFQLSGASGRRIEGTGEGEGRPILLLHGLTAHRELVVHGSRALVRAGFSLWRYDARGHGSSEGTGPGSYTYGALAADLARVLERVSAAAASGQQVVLVGHSMGAHTIVRHALDDPAGIAALVVIGPASTGAEASPGELAHWDSLARGLERDGIDGFLAALDEELQPPWRDVIIRIAGERMKRHHDLGAVAQALEELPRSAPIGSLDELAGIDLPVLVVASHDEADPGHPYEVARAYADAIPGAELISEEPGESPLAWQGGKLSREIAVFCERRGISGA